MYIFLKRYKIVYVNEIAIDGMVFKEMFFMN